MHIIRVHSSPHTGVVWCGVVWCGRRVASSLKEMHSSSPLLSTPIKGGVTSVVSTRHKTIKLEQWTHPVFIAHASTMGVGVTCTEGVQNIFFPLGERLT